MNRRHLELLDTSVLKHMREGMAINLHISIAEGFNWLARSEARTIRKIDRILQTRLTQTKEGNSVNV